jgi:hypothetical protein
MMTGPQPLTAVTQQSGPDDARETPSPAPQTPPNVRAEDHPNNGLAFTLPPELVEQIAQRAAELVTASTPAAEDGWLRGAKRIAEYIDAPVSRVNALSSAGRIPLERDGSNLIARKSDLDAWVRSGGAKRP